MFIRAGKPTFILLSGIGRPDTAASRQGASSNKQISDQGRLKTKCFDFKKNCGSMAVPVCLKVGVMPIKCIRRDPWNSRQVGKVHCTNQANWN